MPIPIPGDLPDPGTESASLASPALAGGFFTTEPLEKSQSNPAATAAKSLQSCQTLCDPMSHSTPGLPVHHQLPEFTQTHIR